jgi:alkylation response protein AidB-like acyl-CoA dehydrogenase
MDLDDTPDEAAFRLEARQWLEAEAEPLTEGEARAGFSEFEDAEEIARARQWQERKADAGWACITWPVEYGGRGGTPMQSNIWRQEEARVRTPPDVFTAGIGMAGPTLLAHGTDEQQRRWLPGMARGEQIWCQLFSEPAAGSDLAALRTSAVRDGDEWVVTGQKLWSSAASVADWGLLVVRTDPDVSKHAGLTYLMVDMRTPGIDARPIRQITGGANFNEVFLTDVRVPDVNRVGEVGRGWSVALTTLMNERSSLGEGGTGGALGVRGLLALAETTHDERGPLLEDDAVCEAIADCYVRSKGIVYTSLRTLTALSRGVPAGPEVSIAKLVAGRMRQQMMSLAMDLQDLFGAVVEPEPDSDHLAWDHGYLFAPAARIAGGSDEILRNIIAERVLGLPAEPRVDKGIAFRDIPMGPEHA